MKKAIKRFFAIVLCLSLCLQSGFAASAASAAPAVDYSEEISLLKTLGIVDVSFDAEAFDTTKAVTRAEFAQYVMRLMNFDILSSETLYYNDVSKNHYAYDEITTLTKYGYFSGVDIKKFDPEAAMVKDHAFIVFLKLIGLTKALEAKNYDMGYIYGMCVQTGLLEGVSDGSASLTQGTLFKMLYNALDAKCYGEDFSGEYVRESDENLLYTTRKMIFMDNVQVTAVAGTEINGRSTEADTIVIGGKTFPLPNFEVYEYLGRNVDYIYREAGRDDIYAGELIRVTPAWDNDTTEIEVTPDCSFNRTTGKLTYYVGDIEKKVTIPSNITLIYNGQFKGSGVYDVFGHDRYSLTLLEDAAGKYTTAIVWEYSNFVVDSINVKEMVAYGKGSNRKLDLNANHYDTLEIVDMAGGKSSFDKIKQDDVLSIYFADGNKRARVCVVDSKVSGQVKTITDGKMIVADKKYEFFDENTVINGYLGKNVTLFTDVKGYVAYCRIESSASSTVGYLYQAGVIGGAFEETLALKILNEDGTINTYKTDAVTINNVRYNKRPDDAFAVLSGGGSNVIPQLVSYVVNADGKVTKIDTAYDEEALGADGEVHPLTVNARVKPLDASETDTSQYAYHTVGSQRIGRKMAINSKTKVFVVPADGDVPGSPDKNFNVRALVEGTYPNAISYRTTAEPTFFEQYVVVKQGVMATKHEQQVVMVDYVFQRVDSEGEVRKAIRFVDGEGVFSEVDVDTDACDVDRYNLQRGDMITFARSQMTKEITDLKVYYQPSTNTKITLGTVTEEFRIFYGWVNSAFPEGVRLGYNSGRDFDEILNQAAQSRTTVVVYDKDINEIIVGDYTDLKTYKTSGADCSLMIATSWYTNARYMFAHK